MGRELTFPFIFWPSFLEIILQHINYYFMYCHARIVYLCLHPKVHRVIGNSNTHFSAESCHNLGNIRVKWSTELSIKACHCLRFCWNLLWWVNLWCCVGISSKHWTGRHQRLEVQFVLLTLAGKPVIHIVNWKRKYVPPLSCLATVILMCWLNFGCVTVFFVLYFLCIILSCVRTKNTVTSLNEG